MVSNSQASSESIVSAFRQLHEWTQNVDRSEHQREKSEHFAEIHMR